MEFIASLLNYHDIVIVNYFFKLIYWTSKYYEEFIETILNIEGRVYI